jgi:hypothetical protein
MLKNKSTLPRIGLLLSTLVPYLSWGLSEGATIAEIEWDLIQSIWYDTSILMNPYISAPMIGQFLLLISLITNRFDHILLILGVTCISFLFVILLVFGAMTLNIYLLLSLVPNFVLTFINLWPTKI